MKKDSNEGLHFGPEIDKIIVEWDKTVEAFQISEKASYLLSLGTNKSVLDILSQIPKIMKNSSDNMAARIYLCMQKYEKIDKWLSWQKYNKQTHVNVLSEYKDFLSKYGLKKDAEAVQIRIDTMQKEIDEKSKKIFELWSNVRRLLQYSIGEFNPSMIAEVKRYFIEINKLAYEIGYNKTKHEFMLKQYSEFLEKFSSKEEADAIKKDMKILRTGYDKNLFITTFSEYKNLFLELGFEEDAELMQKCIDDISKQ